MQLIAAMAACCALCGCERAESGREDGPAAADSQAGAPAHDVSAGDLPRIGLSPAFPKLTFQRPVFFTHAPDGTDRVYVVEQPGRIVSFTNRSDVERTDVFLDIRSQVRSNHNEEGLLSLVFHPKYADNGRLFVYYTKSNPKRNAIVEFARSKDDPAKVDPASEKLILEVAQKYGNHNGSTLLFGPDGFLYASFGDGGLANDPDGNGQNLGTLLATIIRIDIDRPEESKPYSLPPDNPFLNTPGARPEIWAYGLRNVWRMSFDPPTGQLWAGDVGQNAWEEIDLIVKGGNYGWNIREGAHPFKRGSAKTELIEPVVEYSHRDGLSITGGYVYRGTRNPRLVGAYLYADYASRKIWALRYENGKVTAHREVFGGEGGTYVTSFGEDADRELYVCGFDRMDGGPGRIFRIVEQ
jgi:glucose/arabinose dehydrogenase